MPKIVTIHQPDFMPWIGFFVKVWRSECLVVLDHTVNNIRDGSWFRRVRMLVSGQPNWVSIPLTKPPTGPFQPLNEMRIAGDAHAAVLFSKYVRSFEQSYSRAPFYPKYRDLFLSYFASDEPLLAARNLRFILDVLSVLGVDRQVVRSSDMALHGSSNELLVDILAHVGGDVYLCGDGADGYQDDSIFEAAGIRVVRNRFQVREYSQAGQKAFVPGLSIVDLLMNAGEDGARSMIESYGAVS